MTTSPALVRTDRTPRTRTRTAVSALVTAVLALTGVGVVAAPADAAVSVDADVVIDEVYGGGGNSGAALTHDFVELYNRGEVPVRLDGWTLQYASATGAFTGGQNTNTLEGVVAPGATFLVQLAQGAGGTEALPAPDETGTLALGGSAGKIALASDTTTVTGPDAANVVDLVAYGPAATGFAGTGPAPATSNTTSVSRSADHAHTADNAADFVTGSPSPTNAAGETWPAPTDPEEPGDPQEPEVIAIADIQGTGAATALSGTVTTEGVVTAHYGTGGYNGYVVQTAGSGGAVDLAAHDASDAVFVYARTAAVANEVSLGASVRVTGTVGEYEGLTQITVDSGGAKVVDDLAAPAPVVLDAWPSDADQRESLESMLVEVNEQFTVSNTYTTNQYGEVGLATGGKPLRQPTDVALPGSAEAAAVVADNLARGVILDDGGSIDFTASDRTTGALRNGDLTPAYVSLTEPVVVGATARLSGAFVLDYRFDAWRLNPTQFLIGDGTGTDQATFTVERPQAPDAVGGDVSVASFNVLNYFTTLGVDDAACVAYLDRDGDGNNVREGCAQRGAWDEEDLARQQSKIVAAINRLDASVVGLMEIENSAKVDGADAADEATKTLVNALNDAAGSAKWAVVPSSDDLPDLAQQDVITSAIIYQPALVETVGAARALGTQSGPGEAFDQAREPLAQTFAPVEGGEDFLFVVNHFKSKGSAATSRPGDQEAGSDGQGASNLTRVEQATALAAWIGEIQGDTDAVLLAGDFNAYGQEDPLRVLADAGYADAEAAFELDESSYSFSGLAGSLDHVLMNAAARARATGADIWNINSGESVALEYSRYNAHGTLFWEDGPYRSSDHDPIKVGLAAGAAAPVELTLLGINDFHGRIDANTVNFAGTIEQLREQAAGPSLFLSSGDNIGASLFASSVQQDQPTLDVLDALELATSAVGNHEFDRGFADLTGRVSEQADFDYLGANVYAKGTQTPALDEYDLFEVAGGVTVGVVGAVTEETPALVTPAGISDVDFGDPVEAVNRVSAQLSDGDPANGEADVVVALYHEGAGAGTPDGATLEEEVAAGGAFARIVNDTSADVDAVFTGHTHKEYAWEGPVPGTDRTRPIVQTGSYGANIGKITLTIDPASGEVSAHTQENVARTTVPAAELVAAYPRVAAVQDIVADALAYAAEIGNQPVATVDDDITTAFAGGSFVDGVWTGGTRDDRASESALGNLVAESIRSTLADLPDGAQIGVTNPGGLRADLYDTQAEFGSTAVPGLADGQISYSQALAVLPFTNTMGLVTLTGAQFDTLLEQQWQRNPDGTVPSRPYLQLGLSDNVGYTFDESRAEGDRVTSITVDGVPLDPEAEYRIGTLSFLISGGDNFRVFTEGSDAVDTGLVDYEAWIEYLGAHSPVSASYAKHAVAVAHPLEAAAGDAVSLAVSELDMTSLGTTETTELSVQVDGAAAGVVPVTAGAATVPLTVPQGAGAGDTVTVTLTAAVGTVVTIPIRVVAGEEPAVASSTRLSALLPVHLNGLLPSTLVAVVRVPGQAASGTVEFREGDEVVGTATVRSGIASHRLPTRLARGVHTYTAVFVPSDPTAVAGSTSDTVRVRVLF